MPNSSMQKDVETEFTHQARQMAEAPAFNSQSVLERLLMPVRSAASDAVLELACGPGILAEAIAPHIREIAGIDLTPEMIRLARERFDQKGIKNGLFSVAAAEQLPFLRGCFHQVVTRLSLHHLKDVGRVLTEIRRVLRPGGRLIVADVLSSGIEEESVLHNSLEKLRDPTHVRMFPRAELVSLIGLAGFSVQSHETWQQERSFNEWAEIVADDKRTVPLEHVMRALARAGQTAGIALREEGGELLFTHTWILVVSRAD